MTDDVQGLVERLRGLAEEWFEMCGDIHEPLSEAADHIARQERQIKAFREAVEWYGEQARIARLIHSEGDVGRNNLAADGGKRAEAALKENTDA